MRTAAALAIAASALLLSGVPAAAQTIDAWQDWTRRATTILKAVETGSPEHAIDVCRDIRIKLKRQGFQGWPNGLVGACRALLPKSNDIRGDLYCHDLNSGRGLLSSAGFAPWSPEAPHIARRLAAALNTLDQRNC